MERGTEYGLEQVYNVIDSRYRSRWPLIVTTCQRQLENVIFRRDGMSFFGGQHAMGMQP